MRDDSIPPAKCLKDVFFDEQACIQWLFSEGLLKTTETCELCGGSVRIHENKFKCTRRLCRKSKSIFSGTFFSNAKIKPNEIMFLGYLWLTGATADMMLIQSGHNTHTVADYNRHFRQLVAETLGSDDAMIGGSGVVVEVDETKMGKRKYHRGHHVEGAWVIVGVERTPERRVFAEVVEDRSANTILKILGRHLIEGSVLHTDCWKGYHQVHEVYGIVHHTVIIRKDLKIQKQVYTPTLWKAQTTHLKELFLQETVRTIWLVPSL